MSLMPRMRKEMSETVLKLLADELAAVRIVCPHADCGAVTEVSLKKLPGQFNGYDCPVCERGFFPAGPERHSEHVTNFAKAVQGLVALQDSVRVEIVVPTGK